MSALALLADLSADDLQELDDGLVLEPVAGIRWRPAYSTRLPLAACDRLITAESFERAVPSIQPPTSRAKANGSRLKPRGIASHHMPTPATDASTLHPTQRPRTNTVASDKPTRFRMSSAATNTVLPNKRAVSPASSQDRSRNVACRTIILEIRHFLAKYSSVRLPYPSARN